MAKIKKPKSGPDMRTLADIERHGLSDSAWRARKAKYRRNGLKPGDWHIIRPENLEIRHLRPGMTIENKVHGNRYIVFDINAKTDDRFQIPCIIVIAPEHIHLEYNERKFYYKTLIDMSKFKLVIN